MGLWLHLSNQGYATLYPNHLGLSAESLFILIGAMSIVISFFGCCGSFFESRCCLIIVSHRVSALIKLLLISQHFFLLFSFLDSIFHWSSFYFWVSSSLELWCLCSALELHELLPWTLKMELWSTTTRPIAVEWFHHQFQQSGIKFRLTCNAVESTLMKTGTRLMIGRTRIGCLNLAAERDIQCHPNYTRDLAMR